MSGVIESVPDPKISYVKWHKDIIAETYRPTTTAQNRKTYPVYRPELIESALVDGSNAVVVEINGRKTVPKTVHRPLCQRPDGIRTKIDCL